MRMSRGEIQEELHEKRRTLRSLELKRDGKLALEGETMRDVRYKIGEIIEGIIDLETQLAEADG